VESLSPLVGPGGDPGRALRLVRQRTLQVAGAAALAYAARFAAQAAQGVYLLGYPGQGRRTESAERDGWTGKARVQKPMTTGPDSNDQGFADQDSEPPTPDGEEPSAEQLDADSEPASHPDPDPDAGSDA
jgi:hypothetical protein